MKVLVNEAGLALFEQGTAQLFKRRWFQNLLSDPKRYRAFRETELTFAKVFGSVTRNFDTISNFEDLIGKIMNFQHLTDKMYLLMKWQVEENQTQSLQTYKPLNPFFLFVFKIQSVAIIFCFLIPGFDSFSNLLSTSFEDVESTSFFFTGEEEQAGLLVLS